MALQSGGWVPKASRSFHYWQPAPRFRPLPWLANPGNPAMSPLLWVPEGFFFRSEAAIVSSEAVFVIMILPREKKTLWTRQLQISLPCELVSISVVDWSLYLVPSLSV